MKRNKVLAGISLLMVLAGSAAAPRAWPAHPLVTDDTGTQGRRGLQLELVGENSVDWGDEDGVQVHEEATAAAATVSFGVADSVDAVMSVPLLWLGRREDGVRVSQAKGLSDLALEMKWRFYEKKGLSLALKPGLTLPTGSRTQGLGAGLPTYRAFAIASGEAGPLALHLNAGFVRNLNMDGDRANLWHFSVAPTVEVRPRLRLVANYGIDRNPDRSADVDPMYLLGGFIFAVTEHVDVDFGVKAGLNKAVADRSYLAGMAIRL
ncbi:MAG: transporter [Elusimicrobia bacterium]|nr:transporter [Elusimicrobiota bacterium]